MEKDNGKVFIILALLGVVLIPLIMAKPLEEELDADIVSTEYEEII